ncbi:hypothetical protein DQP56_24070, partial [Mycolicibacter senuensis]
MSPWSAPAAQADPFDEVIATVLDSVAGVFGFDPGIAEASWELGAMAVTPLAGFEETVSQWVQAIWLPLHEGMQAWIAADDPILAGLNQLSEALGLGAMIANGADGTAAHLDGFDGGWLFGDGGAGYHGGVTDGGYAVGAGGD